LLELAVLLGVFIGYSPGPIEEGTFVPLSIWVNIYFVYFNLFAISAFLLSRAVAKGY
jgi:hypothetical protein